MLTCRRRAHLQAATWSILLRPKGRDLHHSQLHLPLTSEFSSANLSLEDLAEQNFKAEKAQAPPDRHRWAALYKSAEDSPSCLYASVNGALRLGHKLTAPCAAQAAALFSRRPHPASVVKALSFVTLAGSYTQPCCQLGTGGCGYGGVEARNHQVSHGPYQTLDPGAPEILC